MGGKVVCVCGYGEVSEVNYRTLWTSFPQHVHVHVLNTSYERGREGEREGGRMCVYAVCVPSAGW